MKRWAVGVVSLGATFGGLLSSSVAEACSGALCTSAGFVGETDEETLSPPIPANAPALRFAVARPLASFEPPPTLDVTLAQRRGNASTPLSATVDNGKDFIDVVFSAALTEGDTLVASGALHHDDDPDGGAPECNVPAGASWTVMAAAPLPKKLGTLEITTSQEEVRVGGGAGCWEMSQASKALVRVELAKEAQPWGGVLAYETWVDGERWSPVVQLVLDSNEEPNEIAFIPGGALLTQARGSDVIYALCPGEDFAEESERLEAGAHEVEIRAVVPGTDTVLVAGPVTVNLTDCKTDRERDSGVGDTDSPTDPDTTAPTGKGTGENRQETSPSKKESSKDSGGCSASTQRSVAGALPGWLLLLAGAAWWRRRPSSVVTQRRPRD